MQQDRPRQGLHYRCPRCYPAAAAAHRPCRLLRRQLLVEGGFPLEPAPGPPADHQVRTLKPATRVSREQVHRTTARPAAAPGCVLPQGSTNTRCCRLTTTGTHLNSVGRATVVDVGGPSRPFGSLQGCCRRLLAHSSASVQEGNYSEHGKIRQVHCRRDRKHSPHTSDQTAGSPTPPARVVPRRSLRLAERTLSRPAQLRFLTMPTHRVARRAARAARLRLSGAR